MLIQLINEETTGRKRAPSVINEWRNSRFGLKVSSFHSFRSHTEGGNSESGFVIKFPVVQRRKQTKSVWFSTLKACVGALGLGYLKAHFFEDFLDQSAKTDKDVDALLLILLFIVDPEHVQ